MRGCDEVPLLVSTIVPHRVFFGWKVVAVAFLVATFAWGTGFYGPAVYLSALHGSRGWSIRLISTAVTLHFLWSAFLVVHLASAHQRFGVVHVTCAGIALLPAGILCWSLATVPWMFTGYSSRRG